MRQGQIDSNDTLHQSLHLSESAKIRHYRNVYESLYADRTRLSEGYGRNLEYI